MGYDIDIESFIDEVRKYPILWDSSNSDYRDKQRKKDAWVCISKLFCSDYDEKTENQKNEIVYKMMNKWRNIRDTFTRSEKKRMRSGKPSGSYIYAKQLSFLMDGKEQLQTVIDEESVEVTVTEEPPLKRSATPKTLPRSAKRRQVKRRQSVLPVTHVAAANVQPDDYGLAVVQNNDPTPQHLLTAVNENSASAAATLPPAVAVSSPNEDKLFFDSLIPAVASFNMDQKLKFRSGVLKLIKTIRRRSTYVQSLNSSSPTGNAFITSSSAPSTPLPVKRSRPVSSVKGRKVVDNKVPPVAISSDESPNSEDSSEDYACEFY